MVAPDRDRRAQSFVGVAGRHPHVDHRDIRAVLDGGSQRVGVAYRRDPPGARDRPGFDQAGPDHGGVLGDDHLHARAPLRHGGQLHGHHRGAAARAGDLQSGRRQSGSGRPARTARRRAIGQAPPSPSSVTRIRSRPRTCTASRPSAPRAAVLGHVGEQFGRAEVRHGLDRRRRPVADVHNQLDRDRAARGQGGQRVGQPVVEHRRVDAAGQDPQLGDGLHSAKVRGAYQLGNPVQIGGLHRAVRATGELVVSQAQLMASPTS